MGETTERSAHLEKLKQLFEAAPISRYLGMTLSYCENGVARVRLPFRAEFEESHGVIHGGLIGLLADTAGNFAVGSVSPGSTVKTVEFKMSLLAGVQEDLLAIGEVVRKGRSLATCRLEVVGGNDHVGGHRAGHLCPPGCLAICTCLLQPRRVLRCFRNQVLVAAA